MKKKTYFASDFHLGVGAKYSSREREQQIIRWLEMVEKDAEALYLIGDVFEFWFEYPSVVPKGYVRLLGKLATMRDAGLPIYFFTGNHDIWMFQYFEEELGIPTYRQPIAVEIQGKHFYIGHGDGLGPGDIGYKWLKKVFTNRFCQTLFSWLHPTLGMKLAGYSSKKSREAKYDQKKVWQGEEKEWLVAYCQRKLDTLPADFFVFGHRHLPTDFLLKNKTSRYINTGDWLYHNSYAVFDGEVMRVEYFENNLH